MKFSAAALGICLLGPAAGPDSNERAAAYDGQVEAIKVAPMEPSGRGELSLLIRDSVEPGIPLRVSLSSAQVQLPENRLGVAGRGRSAGFAAPGARCLRRASRSGRLRGQRARHLPQLRRSLVSPSARRADLGRSPWWAQPRSSREVAELLLVTRERVVALDVGRCPEHPLFDAPVLTILVVRVRTVSGLVFFPPSHDP